MKNQDIKVTNKTEFIKFFISNNEYILSDTQKSEDYLKSEGLDTTKLVSNGLANIKKIKLEIQAQQTKIEMNEIEATIKKKAEDWVNNLLDSIDFSIPKIIKEENLALSFKNVESLTKEDIKEILINHFTLKFLPKK